MNPSLTKDTLKILDYWYVIEFLSQDSYEMCTGAAESRRKVKAYKKKLAEQKPTGENPNKPKQDDRKHITAFLDLDKTQSFYEVLKAECESCRMGTWGSLTVYLGKVKREDCIDRIAEYIGADKEDRPEKSQDELAVASFQVDPFGRYIPRSFSLSAVVWAVNQLKGERDRMLSGVLSVQEYQQTVDEMERIFWRACEEEQEEEALQKAFLDKPPVFSDEAVSMEHIAKIYDKIRQSYLQILPDEEVYGVSVQFFKDRKAKEQYEEDSYLGLGRAYFAGDLKMVKEQIEQNGFGGGEGMEQYLLDYINAPSGGEKVCGRRRDLLRADNRQELELALLEILNLKNAPLGKWPSRYMLVLMQQLAVNFATAPERIGLFGENGAAFSVNGPPGTGKTTLLKEVVADHIIQKARRLAAYEDPDDAFEKHGFLHGDKPNRGYSKYISGWYSLKDDSINDYSLLVTSCNNTAVENITKELPLESGITSNLRTSSGDGELMREQLEQIEALFCAEQSNLTEHLFHNKGELEGDYREIYFTEYARKLFDKKDVWGLVAAPLGKRSNITPFYKQVLDPLHWDFYPNGQFKEKRKASYGEARKRFEEQLNKVLTIQEQLSALADAAQQAKQAQRYRAEVQESCEAWTEKEQKKLEQLYAEQKEGQDALKLLCQIEEKEKKQQEELGIACETLENTRAQQNQALIAAQKQAVEAMSSVGFLTRLLFKKKYQDAENLAETFRRQAAEIQEQLVQSEQKLTGLKEELDQAWRKSEATEAERKQTEKKLRELASLVHQSCASIEKQRQKAEAVSRETERIEEQWHCAAERFAKQEETRRGSLLDDAFMGELLSEDDRESTRAQTTNPWTTEYYNREREKLLYEALQLTREFILNSKCCRDNFTTLGQYWGIGTNEDKKRVIFHKADREAMAGALYQTLFLLVPVVSSTFASVGTLFRDVKMPGMIGTLVVDEAGQAQPQMAVGALFRSRRALIVGDPKQVEPVVTDDLDLLKKAWKEDLIRFYQDKTLSVQKCADIRNPFGTYLENGRDEAEWVGCPLLVHRRCISPMYEISNRISYGGIMKQQTFPPGEEKQKNFVYEKSQWINVAGVENGKKDHFVRTQGEAVCSILELAFQKSDFPNLYIISPFKSVIHGMRKYVKEYCSRNAESHINRSPQREEWLVKNMGTVHTFQGKEANEVIFLLGCDTGKDAAGAVGWVNSNIVNVAVTRAKYRLYVIGDIKAWEANDQVNEMKAIMDTYALKEIARLRESNLSDTEKAGILQDVCRQLPSAAAFPVQAETKEDGITEYTVDTESFLRNLDKEGFLKSRLSKEQLWTFGFRDQKELDDLPDDVKRNVSFGIRLYYLLMPFLEAEYELDASCCAILFCKALERQIQNYFYDGLKNNFPDYSMPGSRPGRIKKLQDAKKQDLLLGTVATILRTYRKEIAALTQSKDEACLTYEWWTSFQKRLGTCAKKRNACCHASWFKRSDLMELIRIGFREESRAGVFFESTAGKRL